jgi:FPC/CPF motif-containing protein YcgG
VTAQAPPPEARRDGILSVGEIPELVRSGALSAWASSAYTELTTKVQDDAFPCTFGTVALRKGDLLVAFVETDDVHAIRRSVRDLLIAYTDRVRPLTPVAASLLPFAVFVARPAHTHTIAEYFHYGWSLLQWLHEHDPEPWPARVPRDPDDPAWSFCFGGMPLFVNFKTPAHVTRRSRRMGSAYLLLFQTRDGFDVVAGDTPQGRRARDLIRAKLARYDPIPPYPELAHYGSAANREWKQYFVPDDNAPVAGACPFVPLKGKSASS